MELRCHLLREVAGNPFRPAVVGEKCVSCNGHGQVGMIGNNWQTRRCEPCQGKEARSAPIIAWSDHTIPRMARHIHDSGDWSAMGPLHDALLEAIADTEGDERQYEELLMHLRGRERCLRCNSIGRMGDDVCGMCESVVLRNNVVYGTGTIPLRTGHVRGCWAVRLLMGNS